MSLPQLKTIRERRGWTQKDVAERAGLSLATVSRAEQGRTNTKGDALLKIAIALQVSTDSLLGRDLPENAKGTANAAERSVAVP